ncbi:MAG: ASKHA domain-containing protein [Methanomassiliicoccales archaeon]|nr:ASKHA domain-containing protein [Methanomassiliicoccales archaeon]
MRYKVRFKPDDVELVVERGTTILEAAVAAKVDISTSCGGKGTCKKCRVIVEGPVERSTQKVLDKEMANKGYSLACQSFVVGDIVVFVPEEARMKGQQILKTHRDLGLGKLSPLTVMREVTMEPPSLVDNVADLERLSRSINQKESLHVPLSILKELPRDIREWGWKASAITLTDDLGGGLISLRGPKDACHIGAAVDIGTTTLVLSLVDMESGTTISTTSDYNRQSRAGDDIIARITRAEEGGLDELQDLVLRTIDHLLLEARASSERPIAGCDVTALSVAGNTTMVHLFLGLDPRWIRYEPYIPVTNIPPLVRGKDLGLGIAPEAPVYIVPGRAGFVGGDITADVLASGMHERSELSLLIDVGTNGEVVVGNHEMLVACSTSAGPAFEGGEVASGMRATQGAIEKVRISQNLEPELEVIGKREPQGICGSGLIDLVAQMFLRGLIDKKGRIQDIDPNRTRRGEEGALYVLREGSGAGKEIAISDADLANIIRTKAAVYAGCSVLLKAIDKGFADLERIYIAGGFGNYIDVENAVTIGLLPDLPRKRFEFIGNAALAGALLTLLSREKRAKALQVHEDMTYVELSTSQAFFDEFSSASFLPHTDAERFPSVIRRSKVG